MHFGKRLERDMVERWRPHYLQYKLLKKHIKEMQENLQQNQQQQQSSKPSADRTGGSTSEDSANGLLANQQISYHEFSFPGPKAHRYGVLNAFKPILDKEVEKINVFTTSKVAELQNRILQILRGSQPWKGGDLEAGQVYLDGQKSEAAVIGQELIDLDKFIRQNCIAIQKIIKKFDKRLQFDVAPWLNAQLMENEPFLKVNLDALLMALSDAFEKLALVEHELKAAASSSTAGGAEGEKEDETQKKKKGISAQTFERKTTKYWVRGENIMAIKVAILKNLPIYLFDRKAETKRDALKSRNFLRDFSELYGGMSDSSPITSIYMDNDKLDVYHTRLVREEGAQLFRLRWYGDAKSLPEKEYVFMERKTHHESWVEAKSVKERFPIKTKNVQPLLEGKFNPAESMKKWMKPDSKGTKLIKNEQELQKAIQLSQETFESIQKRHLASMVRTLYRRTAFQARDHNEVRISIDTQLMMVNEDVKVRQGEYPWCRDMVNSSIPPSDILQFPYCILEVKLNCDNPPKWIADLLADTRMIVECHKFSKFLTGVAYHEYDKVRELPHWFKGQVAIDPRNRNLPVEEREKLLYASIAMQFKSESGEVDDDDEEDSESEYPASSSVAAGKKPEAAVVNSGKSHRKDEVTAIDMGGAEYDESTPLMADVRSESAASSRGFSKASSVVTFSPDTKLETGESSKAASRASGGGQGGVFSTFRNRLFGNRSEDRDPRKPIAPLKPVRSADRVKIEPKTSFANERTLIQWVSAASLMITLATLIMTSGSEIGFKAGFVFFPLAFVIMLYAVIRYQYRAWSFRHRRNQYHDDLYGPVFLVIAIASAMGVIMFLMFYYNSPIPVATPDNQPLNGCEMMTAFDSTATIEPYFPYSDLTIQGDSRLYAVGPFSVYYTDTASATISSPSSGNQQTRFSAVSVQYKWQKQVVGNQHISSVVGSRTNPDVLYFGVERPVMQLVRNNSVTGERKSIDLTKYRDWYNLTMKSMALISESSVSDGDEQIFILTTGEGTLFRVRVFAGFTQVELIDVIPSSRVANGLVDDLYFKSVSGLYYEPQPQNRLYVLFGRSRRVRIFNFTNFTLINEWYLPGTSFQWSGIALAPTTSTSTAPSANKAPEYVYLSQSVPGAIWKFKLTDAAQNFAAEIGKAFQECANTYDGDLVDMMKVDPGDKLRRNSIRYVSDY